MKEMFYTRSGANAGARLPLLLPNGQPSEHWLHVVGADSDQFRSVDSQVRRAVLSHVTDAGRQLSDAERAEFVANKRLELLASAVTGWSFPEPCNDANKLELLREAPQIADAVDRFIANRSFFTNGAPVSSASAPESQPS